MTREPADEESEQTRLAARLIAAEATRRRLQRDLAVSDALVLELLARFWGARGLVVGSLVEADGARWIVRSVLFDRVLERSLSAPGQSEAMTRQLNILRGTLSTLNGDEATDEMTDEVTDDPLRLFQNEPLGPGRRRGEGRYSHGRGAGRRSPSWRRRAQPDMGSSAKWSSPPRCGALGRHQQEPGRSNAGADNTLKRATVGGEAARRAVRDALRASGTAPCSGEFFDRPPILASRVGIGGRPERGRRLLEDYAPLTARSSATSEDADPLRRPAEQRACSAPPNSSGGASTRSPRKQVEKPASGALSPGRMTTGESSPDSRATAGRLDPDLRQPRRLGPDPPGAGPA